MHVGLVVYGGLDRTSGGFRYDRKLVSHLEERGDEVEVIAIPWRSYPRHLGDACSRSIRSRLNRPFDVLVQDELCHPSLWRHNPRLDRPGAIVALVHLLRSGGPQTRLGPLYRTIERRYLETVDAAVCTSADTRDRTRELATVPTLVAPPAGRIEGAAVTPERVTARAQSGPLRVAFVGNLLPRKGLSTLLSGLAHVDGSDPGDEAEWHLTVVGSHDADPATARRAVERATVLGIADRVTFTGEVSNRELESILERSHVLAVPARYEGFGMVYLEAMEYGVVPIASAVGGASEFVADGRAGFLVDPDDAGQIGALVAELATDRDRLAALGHAALETAAAHPTWAETMDRVRSFLRARIDTGAGGRSGPATGSRLEGARDRPSGGDSS
ncbi:glycosyltransferase family 4 protein [Natronobeatus ordinarius]|uniref:glycosyltransferase family 4 protein n=1 Tax=Natronobeatus ordinarius TaxID=2963433 RepID=UPI0020CD2D3F|nr:glycosyltransferase family 4 protein [Natronobeatus ordinarius]